MIDIDQKALALWNEVRAEREYVYEHNVINRNNDMAEALCRAIEQHEAFRQEVHDAVMQAFPNTGLMPDCLSKLIIPAPKPDALVDVLLEMDLSSDLEEGQHDAKWLRIKLDALGFEIREKNDE